MTNRPMTNRPKRADADENDEDRRQALRAELLYKAGDIRTLALAHPAHADLLIAVGDLVDAAAGLLTRGRSAAADCANALPV